MYHTPQHDFFDSANTKRSVPCTYASHADHVRNHAHARRKRTPRRNSTPPALRGASRRPAECAPTRAMPGAPTSRRVVIAALGRQSSREAAAAALCRFHHLHHHLHLSLVTANTVVTRARAVALSYTAVTKARAVLRAP